MSGFIVGTIIKKITATIISIAITVSTFFTGNCGEYQKLSIKPLSFEDNLLAEISLKLTLSPDAISLFSGMPSGEETVYELNFSMCADKENVRLAFLDDKKRELLLLDTNGLAISSELVTMMLSFVGDDYLSAYNRYFPDKVLYTDFDKLIPYDAFSYEQLDYIKELQKSADELDFLFGLFKSEESISYITKLCTYVSGMLEKYCVQCEIEGVTGYSCKMSIKDSFEYMKNYLEYTESEEFIEETSSFAEYLVLELSKAYPHLSPEEGTNIKEEMKEELRSSAEAEEAIALADAIMLGDVASLGELAVLLPFINNSFAEAVIYEKNSVISERTRTVISDGETEYITFEAQVNSQNTDMSIPSSEEFAKFENRVTFEQIDCKRAYEKARSEKVSNIDIFWVSTMAQNYSVPDISGTNFSVDYFSGNTDSTDSVAYLLDGSIYLPLRKITEYAGYDVSWDAENRKAYVIVDAMPVDMTGVLIDGKTYVKIRDFEKLGAAVAYNESFLYNNAYNDFQKECYANITFAQ